MPIANELHNRIAGLDAIHEITWRGSVDPSTDPANDVQPHQLWMDESVGTAYETGMVLKERNTANTGWMTRFDLAAIFGVANGVATLDGSGLIPAAQLPPLAISDVSVVASQAAMLALTAERGDFAIRTDVNKTFILATNSPSTLADWKEVLVGAAAPSGTAGGDLGGSYPNPDVLKINGNTVPAGVGLGDLLYGSAASALSKLAGQTSATPKILQQTGTGSASAAPTWVAHPEVLVIPISDEATAITTGTAKVTFRMPFAMHLTDVRASLTAASSAGTPTFDINEGGASILSTKLTVDATETTSTTAATPAVISDPDLADAAEITIDVDVAGTDAKGAKIYLIGTRA